MTTTADSDRLIKSWRASSVRKQQVAAELAAKIQGGQYPSWSELPTLGALSREYDTSERTVSAAKNLLGLHGFLRLEDRRYYVI